MIRRISLATPCWCAVLSLSAAPCSLWAQEDDPALRERFLTGVAQTARKLERLSFRVQCQYTSTYTNGEVNRANYEMAMRGPYGLETGLNKTDGRAFLQARNGLYAFRLHWSAKGKPSLIFLEQVQIS